MAFDQPNQSQQAQPEQRRFSNSAEEWEYNNRYGQNYRPYFPMNAHPPRDYPTNGYSATSSSTTYSQSPPQPPSWGQNIHRYESMEYPYSRQPQPNIPYDPIRSNSNVGHYLTTAEGPYASSNYERSNSNNNQPVIPPIMSISQLLSSDNNSERPAASAAALNPVHTDNTLPNSNESNSQRRNNGIQNLLNNDDNYEEKYEMADTDTDNEDHPTMYPAEASTTATATATIDAALDTHFDIKPKVIQSEDSESSMDDDFSDVEKANTATKSRVDMIREELNLMSDDDEDNEVFLVHKEEMLQFMLNNHKRGKQVIEEYEKKLAGQATRGKMRESLEQLYEKRYGTRMPKGEVLKQKIKAKNRRKSKYNGYDDMVEHSSDSDIDFHDMRHTSERKVEMERKQVWANIVKKDIPRMNRILSRVQATRSGNCKKVAQYCQKEVRRAATNGGRANRDLQNKAKRVSKEMLLFWKKNEKEERELRKKAEKEALDRLKQEEERREAQRQARKLNFLITQTELYSHFIGRKIKQDTEEDEETAQPAPSGLSTPLAPVLPQDELDERSGVTDIGTVDFDEEDETVLKEKARLSAQNALAKQREKTREFDQGARERRIAAGDDVSMALDDMNFQEPSSMGSGPEVKQPNMLMCQLKSYQIKGLSWLANLYEQGINGILADEMGLGKTVQSISLLAYLAEVHNIWGPFLVIAPASTLHNWQQEFTKFVPQFRALPYWGNPKDRKTLRQFWSRKQLYGKDAPFHIVITSYQLILTDVTYFQRVKWQYMILDEAQAIKSSASARWKQLLSFHCRNRLLLTGTPIQNSMQELWALLHFIMPTLFDSHEEFSEWFSKDIESHAENKGSLNEHQLRRLHMILKPFMLRRIKRNVQHELGEKIEVEVFCELTARQKALYRGLKEKISISELLEKATSLGDNESMDSLMNLVMQFRKVCNHPELFERGDVQAPLSFCNFSDSGHLSKETILYCPYSSTSPIKFHIPKRLYRDGGVLKTVGPHTRAGFDTKYLDNLMNIWDSEYIYQSQFSNEADAGFSFLRFVDVSPHEASYLSRGSLVERWVDHLSKREQRARRNFYQQDPTSASNTFAMFLISDTNSPTSPFTITPGSALDELTHISDKMIHQTRLFGQCYSPAVKAVPVDAICDDVSFLREKQDTLFNMNTRSCFFGTDKYISKLAPEQAANLSTVVRTSESGIMTVPASGHGFSSMKVPSMKDVILDSGKLATLDKLLEKLKSEDHRCLVYFQMTKMIDLFEEYIAYKQYKYLRLDGSSKISDRRDMVQDWQTRPEIFIFLLSTRAGGLGINLTAADTVIFYDSDWNPTVDQQAMDRAHRLGQTKQVTVYRLITRNTIEERILQRAKQKDEIQKVVISGGEFRQVDFKPREIVSLLLDDEELDDKLQQQLKRKAEEDETQKKKPTKKSKRAIGDDSTPALSPSNVDRLFSAGEDTFLEDESSGASTPVKKTKGTRIGRPRTNISFTG